MLRVEPVALPGDAATLAGLSLHRLVLARTVAGRPLYLVAAYALGDTLIDSGPPATARELLAWSRQHGIRRVLHTHQHEDHVGGSWLLARELGVEVLAPAATLPVLHQPYRLPLYRALTWGRPRPCPQARLLPCELEIGPLRLRVLPTPGHSHDHVAFLVDQPGETAPWVFSGDLYVARRVQYLRQVENAWVHMDSLRRLASYQPSRLMCAHGGVVDNAEAAIAGRLAYWLELAEKARALHGEGLSATTIRRRLLGREGTMGWLSLGDITKRNLIASLLFHAPTASNGQPRPASGEAVVARESDAGGCKPEQPG